MRIARKNEVMSLPLELKTVESLYGEVVPDDNNSSQDMTLQLKNVIEILSKSEEVFHGDFTCYIEKKAYDAFVAFANDVYYKTKNEACGVFVGYYLHNPHNISQKLIVATNFLESHGPASRVTCEISFDDNIRFGNFCDENKVYPVVWVHSHPGFGTFYSGTDSDTLSRAFRAPHQMGIVVDILQNNISMGFKIIDNVEKHENVYILDVDKSQSEDKACILSLYLTQDVSSPSIPESNKKKEREGEHTEIEENCNNSTDSGTVTVKKDDISEENQQDFVIPGAAVQTSSRPVIRMGNTPIPILDRILRFIKDYGTVTLLSIISVELLFILLKLCR